MKNNKKTRSVRLTIGNNGKLLRGLYFGIDRRPHKLETVVSQDEYCEKRVLTYLVDGACYSYICGYEYFGNGPDHQWIDISAGNCGIITICNRGDISLDVYYGWPVKHVVILPKQQAVL